MDVLVKDFMIANPFCVEPEASVQNAFDLMVDEGIYHLPVVDTHRYVVGVVSIGDLAAALRTPVGQNDAREEGDRLATREAMVSQAMSFSPVVVFASTTVEEAGRRMVRDAIGCLPVVDEHGRLEGIVSEADILEAYACDASGRAIDPLSRAEVAGNRIVQALRDEGERLVQSLPLYDQIGPQLAIARLRSIEDAIVRSERGELHVCARCNGRISANRLRGLPGTTLCSRCAREMEW